MRMQIFILVVIPRQNSDISWRWAIRVLVDPVFRLRMLVFNMDWRHSRNKIMHRSDAAWRIRLFRENSCCSLVSNAGATIGVEFRVSRVPRLVDWVMPSLGITRVFWGLFQAERVLNC